MPLFYTCASISSKVYNVSVNVLTDIDVNYNVNVNVLTDIGINSQ